MNPAEFAQGPLLIGTAINIFLYGVMVTQMYLYFNAHYTRDPFWMKPFVAFLCVCDTANTFFDFIYIYQSLVIHFDDPIWLKTANWVSATHPVMTGIIGGLAQLFFAWRIYVLTKNLLVVSAIVLLGGVSILSSVGTTIGVRVVPQFVHFQKFEVIVIIWLASAACADVIIATVLVLYLRSQKNGYPSTDDRIDRIIRLSIQTGLLTSLCATVDLVFYLADPSGLHLLFNVTLAKLYTNSLMSSLNARGGWKYSNTSSQVTSRDQQTTVQRQNAHLEVVVHVEDHEMVVGVVPRYESHSEYTSRREGPLGV